ncbi:hypothetical protein D3C71_1218970 [compost metagenome]
MNEIMNLGSCATMEEEFWFHVSSQDEIPLAMPRPRSEVESTLDAFLDAYDAHDGDLTDLVSDKLRQNPSLLDELRALVSISDKRLYLDLSYIFSRYPYSDKTLCGCLPSSLVRHQTSFFRNMLARKAVGPVASSVIASYLMEKGLKEILDVYSGLSEEQRVAIVKSLIAPKEVQQQEAKLRGHGPEAVLAKLLHSIGLRLRPADKHQNPMAEHDPNVCMKDFIIAPRSAGTTFSCDMVIVDDDGLPVVCIVSLVHSSDPGQFGVDKAATVVAIRKALDAWNAASDRRVELWGIVDGVGYSENKNGTINVMLPNFDCFIQMKSIWKAAMRAHSIGLVRMNGIRLSNEFYSDKSKFEMSEYIPNSVPELDDVPGHAFVAGEAVVW